MPTKHTTTGSRSYVHRSIPDDPKNRHAHDFYRTPPIATQKLLRKEPFLYPVWEPACGDGMMAKELIDGNRRVIATDLYDRGYGKSGINFLTHKPRFHFNSIITNPPFTHVREFVERALSFNPDKVAMITRLSWLEGKKRKEFFETSPLYRVLVFSGRVNIARSGYDVRDGEGGMIAYCWMIWKRGHKGPATLGWI